jgi:hypothetical protein
MSTPTARSTKYEFFDTRTKDEYCVICGAQECNRRSPWSRSRKGAVKKARKHSWRIRGGRAVCPHCLNDERYGRRELVYEEEAGREQLGARPLRKALGADDMTNTVVSEGQCDRRGSMSAMVSTTARRSGEGRR